MASIRRYWPSAERLIVLVDDPENTLGESLDECALLRPSDLEVPDFDKLAFANSATGLCCLLKPYAALCALAKGHSTVAYFDSDTWLLQTPDAVTEALQICSALLTPHALHPYKPNAARSDFDLMRSGAFNAGFFAVRNDEAGGAFLRWWRDRLLETGALEPAQQYDQSWLNLAPVLFPEVKIWRDPNFNVGFWNITERRTSGAPATDNFVLLHLSLFLRTRPDYLVFADWLRFPAPPELTAKLQSYATELALAGADSFERQPYGFGRFTDGTPVTSFHRAFYRERIFRRQKEEGSPFSPNFRAGPYQGWRSLYRAGGRLPRAVRKLGALAPLPAPGTSSLAPSPKSPSAS
jgi:hypothetical protein